GGGTAGWMVAATITRFWKNNPCAIVLIASEETRTAGAGAATIPPTQALNRTLGREEKDLVKKIRASIKLGIEFVNWGQVVDAYIHAFGTVGHDMEALQFHHYWLKYHKMGKTQDIGEYSLNTLAGRQCKFMRSINAGNSPLSDINYAFHFD